MFSLRERGPSAPDYWIPKTSLTSSASVLCRDSPSAFWNACLTEAQPARPLLLVVLTQLDVTHIMDRCRSENPEGLALSPGADCDWRLPSVVFEHEPLLIPDPDSGKKHCIRQPMATCHVPEAEVTLW